MSRWLHRKAKWTSHDQSAGSMRNLIASGEFFCKSAASPLATMPGSAMGSTWLGQTRPQLPLEEPLPWAPFSTIVTFQPDRIRKYAHAVPITPPPMMTACREELLICKFPGRKDHWGR